MGADIIVIYLEEGIRRGENMFGLNTPDFDRVRPFRYEYIEGVLEVD